MKNLIESVRAMYAPKAVQSEATMMQDDGKMVHNCAKHVEHAEYGRGNTIAEEHADPDRYGNIAWYDITFPHGVERGVPVTELRVLQAESHGHETRAKKKKMAEEIVTISMTAEEFEQLDELSKSTLASYAKKATHDARIQQSIGKDFEADRSRKPGMKAAAKELADKYKSKSRSREAGIGKAVDRLAKEEVEIFMTAEEFEQLDELSKKTLQSYTRKATTASNRASARADKEEDKAMSTDGEKYPAKQARHNAAANQAVATMVKRDTGLKMAGKRMAKEEVEVLDPVDETVIHADLVAELDEAQKTGNYDAHFKAHMKKRGIKHPGELDTPEKKKEFFNAVDAGYKAKNESVFVEAYMSSEIQSVINAHKKAGNRISDEKSGTKDGKPHNSFVVTQPSGKRTRHIYHGTTKKLETMSPAARSKESSEQDLDDK